MTDNLKNTGIKVISPIAYINSPFKEKFGIPRQSGIAESIESRIVFEKEYRNEDMLRGLEGFSHIWLIWGFSENQGWSATVRPPRLGGNTRMGVFATRSPYRPNGMGLSSVRISEIDLNTSKGPVIYVTGADLLDGTPIYDIKPYISMDCHRDAAHGFQNSTIYYEIEVDFPEEELLKLPAHLRAGAIEILKQDPRPSYQNDQNRIYGFAFGENEIHFKVENNILRVIDVSCVK